MINIKKRNVIILVIALALVSITIAAVLWWFRPQRLFDIDIDQVKSMEFLNGNTGKRVTISNPSEMEHMINDLNSLTGRRSTLISHPTSGFHYSLTLRLKNGEEVGCGAINSKNLIKGYITVNSEVDFGYIVGLFP